MTKKLRSKTLIFSTKTITIVKTLYRLGIISNFFIFKKQISSKTKTLQKYIRFTVFFYKNNPFFSKIKLISTSSKVFSINIKTLKLLKNTFRSSLVILSTPYGLLSHKEALKLNTGGKLLYIII